MSNEAQLESLYRSLQEIVWHFGTRRLDGKCFSDLSQVEIRCLRIVARPGICPMGQVARELGLSPSGATRLVDRLESKGVLSRELDSEDGRVCCAHVTLKGLEIIRALEETTREDLRTILGRIPEPMDTILQASLACFASAIRQEDTPPDDCSCQG
jgi:DNA-binding MarR family transcriptional regulator